MAYPSQQYYTFTSHPFSEGDIQRLLLGYDTGPCKDVLRFYDGSGSDSDLLGSYCGTTPPEVIYSSGKYLYVTFHTDSFITYTGLSFRFSAVKEGNCLTNGCHGGMRLFSHTSLMTSKSSKGKNVAPVCRSPSVSLIFLPAFDVSDLFLNRRTATWSLSIHLKKMFITSSIRLSSDRCK